MKLRLAFASLGALAWANAAQAQQQLAVRIDGNAEPVALPALHGAAPPATIITPDQGNPLALGTQVSRSGRVFTIDGGTRAGANLFHSFSRFDLGQGDFARWVRSAGDPTLIQNVINRVTGGDPSDIFGTIDTSALPNADFYFINPAGIVFGEGARINVPAAAHFATAQEVRFASAPAFTVSTPGGSTLSIAAPAAFGFLGGQGTISVEGVGFNFLPNVTDLTLAARDVSFTNSEILANGAHFVGVGTGAAQIDLRGAPPPGLTGSVVIERAALRLTGDAVRRPQGIRLEGGVIALNRANLGTNFREGDFSGLSGSISLVADRIDMLGSLISASSFGQEPAGDVRLIGREVVISGGSQIITETRPGSTGDFGSIEINGRDLVLIDQDSRVSASTVTAQRGGDVNVSGGRVTIGSDSMVESSSLEGATGQAGLVTINAGSLEVRDGGTISSSTSGDGDAGSVFVTVAGLTALDGGTIESRSERRASGDAGLVLIQSGSLTLDNRSQITTSTFGAGDAGVVAINAGSILLDGRSIVQSRAQPGSTGDAGLVAIGGGSLLITGGSAISSDTDGPGEGGGILIDMREVELRDSALISSNSAAFCQQDCVNAGNAGGISIRADVLRITDPSQAGAPIGILSQAGGGGNAGEIMIEAGLIDLESGFISSDTASSGAGGRISLTGGEIALRGTSISSSTFGSGSAGSIQVSASQSLVMAAAAQIRSQTQVGSTGSGGSIRVQAPSITLRDASKISSEGFGAGEGGSIEIAGGDMRMDDASLVSSATHSAARGGSLNINVDTLTVAGGSSIDADSFASPYADVGGQAGDIDITARRLAVIGRVDPDLGVFESIISSSTVTDANAGNVRLHVGELVLDHGRIQSETRGLGSAGTIDIDAASINLTANSQISTNSTPCQDGCTVSGDAGEIRILASGLVRIGSGSGITSSADSVGDAGRIRLVAGDLLLAGGRISTSTSFGSTGRSGMISIDTGSLTIPDVGSIETISRNRNEAGGIMIGADTIRLTGRESRISSSNEFRGRGDAGGISITTDALSILEGAQLTSSSLGGAAGSIQILMPSDSLLRLESSGPASLINTSSGPGLGGRIFISGPRAIISNGGSILALGQQGGANVVINAQYFISSSDRTNRLAVSGNFLLEAAAYDVSSGTVDRDLSVLDASGVLRGQCAAVRATGEVSQLVIRPIGPYGNRPISLRQPTERPLLSAADLQSSCS